MASYRLLFMFVVIILFLAEIPGSDSSSFPIDNCTSAEMDIVELYLMDLIDDTDYLKNNLWDNSFGYGYSKLSDNNNKSRVRYIKIYDGFDYNNNEVNVSSWSFDSVREHPNPRVIEAKPNMYLSFKTALEVIDIKMKFVQRLFSEIPGVRGNATHIAVIFFMDEYFSEDEIKNISHIGQQENTKIKSLFAIFSQRYKQEVIYLNDSIIFSSVEGNGYTYGIAVNPYLFMAMCKQCIPKWFPYEHNNSVHLLSCYSLSVRDLNVSIHGNNWTTIETLGELHFLQTTLYSFITTHRDTVPYTNDSCQVSIRLRRETRSAARRFKWSDTETESSGLARPVVVNHWMSGKPDGGFNFGCAVWQFTDIRKDDNNDSDMAQAFSHYKDRFDEGWLDVPCDHELEALELFETVLYQTLDDDNIINIKPANTKSYYETLKKGDFMEFDGNIVSTSTYVASTHFLTFLKTTKIEFPVFDCGEDGDQPRYISYTFVCDKIYHCTNRRDEMSCLEKLGNDVLSCDSDKYAGSCTGKLCSDGSCLNLQWLNDGEIDCTISPGVNDENVGHNMYLERNETCAFICNRGQKCVYFFQLNDGHKDCDGAEGPLDETIGKLEPANTCYNSKGGLIWAPKCVYIKDRYGAVLGCRDMSHLQNCLDYQCVEGYVKCYKSYCIPQHYVLDGQEDCPTGEEEVDFNIGSCSGNFACWDSKVCLHPDLVCNGFPECPHKDDELNCGVRCTDGLRCVSGTVTVSDYNSFSLSLDDFYYSIKYVDLSGLNVSRMRLLGIMVLLVNPGVIFLFNLSKCNIDHIDFEHLKYVQITHTLDLSHNLLQNFTKMHDSLRNIRHLNLSYNTNLVLVKNLHFSKLEVLDLSHTGLTYLYSSLFRLLPNLRHLDLSFTFVSDVYKNIQPPHFTLQTLDLRGIPIENFYADLFGGLTIDQHLYTDKFEICCPQIRSTKIPYHTCHAPEDAISTCFDLVRVGVQRVLLWVVAVLAILGNMTVIAYRIILDRSVLKTGYGLFVTNLGISDLITGVYLFIIAGADYYYRDSYVLYHKNWRESVVCKIAGFLATLSGETSKLFSLLITLDRFLVIKFPFGQITFSKLSTRIAILVSWFTGFILSLIPTVFMFEIYSSNAMCLGLPLTNQRLKGWEYSFGVFIVLNFLMCLIIAYGQIAIFHAMSDNRITKTASNMSPSRRIEDIIVAKRLFLVVMSDFLCWFPVGVMGLLSLGGYEINNDVYAWTVVLVLPINSAVNPFLYTMSALIARWEKFKNGQGKSR